MSLHFVLCYCVFPLESMHTHTLTLSHSLFNPHVVNVVYSSKCGGTILLASIASHGRVVVAAAPRSIVNPTMPIEMNIRQCLSSCMLCIESEEQRPTSHVSLQLLFVHPLQPHFLLSNKPTPNLTFLPRFCVLLDMDATTIQQRARLLTRLCGAGPVSTHMSTPATTTVPRSVLAASPAAEVVVSAGSNPATDITLWRRMREFTTERCCLSPPALLSPTAHHKLQPMKPLV